MRQGKTLQELATEIQRQKFSKRDFVAPASKLSFTQNGSDKVIVGFKTSDHGYTSGFRPTETFQDQISQYLNIPRDYYRRMQRETPELLVESANTWLAKKPENEKRMVRTLDGTARAFLSDKFRALDNYDLAETVLPILQKNEFNVESCEITEKHMYLKVVTPKISGEVNRGDVLNFGLSISNSEIGYGSLSVQLMAYRLACLNGMISESAVRKYHVGRRNESDASWEVLTDETKKLSDKTFWAIVKDTVQASVDGAAENFQKLIAKAKKATEITLPAPVEVVELISEKYGFSESEQSGVLSHLIQGKDLSLWGLTNAVTAYAQDKDLSYERATEFEQIGGKVIELTAKDLIVEKAA